LQTASGNGQRHFCSNDPFDNQFDLDFPEPTPELIKQQTEQFHALLRSPEPFRPDYFESKEVYEVMEELRQVLQANPDFQYTDDDIAYVEGGTLQGMQNVRKSASEASTEIRRIMADTTIFCVSGTHDSILMWSHYAENHTGAVIEFRAVQEVDSPLLVANPVRYSQEMPRLPYDLIMMDSKKARMDILDTITLSKSEIWAYEKEWRVWATLRDKTKTFEIIPFAPEQIGAVYLGCKMSGADKAEIAEMVGSKYPKVKLFAGEKHPSRFELIFNELTGLTKP
jgi:hypothetical protein